MPQAISKLPELIELDMNISMQMRKQNLGESRITYANYFEETSV